MEGSTSTFKAFTTEPKTRKHTKNHSTPEQPNIYEPHQNHNNHNNTTDSIAKACFSDELVKGLFGGKVVHTSFDCPENLRDAFKLECKRNGLSVCQILRNFMISFIIASRLKACFSNTLSVPYVNIERLVTPIFVKGRVRRFREVEEFQVDGASGGSVGVGVEREVKVEPRVRDYSKLSLEELKRLRCKLLEDGDSTEVQFVAFEIRKRLKRCSG